MRCKNLKSFNMPNGCLIDVSWKGVFIDPTWFGIPKVVKKYITDAGFELPEKQRSDDSEDCQLDYQIILRALPAYRALKFVTYDKKLDERVFKWYHKLGDVGDTLWRRLTKHLNIY